jgi:hypothetical protein|uniref:Tape measure domain protein n=1 Tax=Myoviridae sp. ct7Mg7 TaxID=2827661 RepID=A0A8S5SPE6_9CAUD|nr:MAG TPA: Tape measure domain protein [Myoviridae sp. ct7Mg7]
MNQDNGRLNFVATVDTSQTKKDADELVRIFQNIGKSAERYGIDIDKYIGGGLRSSNDAQRAFKGISDELKAKIKSQAAAVQSLSQRYKEASSAMSNSVMASERQKNNVASLKKELTAEQQELTKMKQLLAEVGEQQIATGGKAESMRSRLRELRETIYNLEIEWRTMSDEQRKSDFGVALRKQLESAKKEGGDLADIMGDVQRAIQSEANDTGKFSALSEGINLAVSSATALTGAMELLGVSEEDAEKVQAQIQAGLAISNGLMQAQNVLQKESNLMIQIGNIQRWAQVKAEAAANVAKNAGTVATIKATVAQRAFNLVAKANPYVLLATAIVTVVGALFLFAKRSDDAKQKQEELNKEIERGKKVQEAYTGAFVDSATDSYNSFQRLRTMYNALGNDMAAKRKFIVDNKDAFHSLGLEITSTAEAESMFNSPDRLQAFQNAMIARARAMGAAAAAAEKYKQAFEEESQVKAPKQWKIVSKDVYDRTPSWKRRKEDKTIYRRDGAYFDATQYFVIDDVAQQKAFDEQRKKNKQRSDAYLKQGDEFIKKQVEQEKQASRYLKQTGYAYAGDTNKRTGTTNKTTTNKSQQIKKTDAEQWFANWKARIAQADELRDLLYRKDEELTATMADESEKRRKTLELNYRREISELNKQMREMAEKNKSEALAKDKNADVSNIGLTTEQQNAMNAIREAIQKRYNYERQLIDKQEKESAQASLDAFNREYGDYTQKRIAIVNQMRREIANAQNEGERKMAKAKGDEALGELDVDFVKKNAKVIVALYEDTANKTVAQLRKVKKEAAELLAWIQSGKYDEAKGKLFGITADQFASLKDDKELQKEITELIRKFGEAADSAEPSLGKFGEAVKNLFSKGGFTPENIQAFCSELTALANAFGTFGKEFQDIGELTGSETIKKIGGGISAVTEEAKGIATDMLTGLLIGGPVGAAIGGAVGVTKSLLKGIFSIGGYDWESYNDMMDRYKSLEETWDRLIDKKKEYISEGYGIEAENIRKDTERLIQEQTEAARRMGNAWIDAGRSWRSRSQGYLLNRNMSDTAKGQAIGAFGSDWQRNILKMSSEQLRKLYEDSSMAQFWAELKQYGGDFYDIIMRIVNEQENLESVADTLNERLTFRSFDDVESSFNEMLTDMGKDAKDFSEDMEDNFQNAIIRTFVYSKYQARLKAFYERWADAMKGDLNAGEMETLRTEYMNIVNDAINERNQIADALGFKKSATEQNSTSGGFQTMSQDTANELNGRFTAIQMDVSSVRQMMAELQGISLNNMGYLEDIAKNTFQLYEMNERLGKIEQNTARL